MKKPWFIVYGLIDPRTGGLRYIGECRNGLARVKTHLNPDGTSRRGNEAHLKNWLRELFSLGLQPGYVIMEEYDDADSMHLGEAFWIMYHRDIGTDLTNIRQENGEGGFVWTDEHRRRQSERLKGKSRPESFIFKMKGRPSPIRGMRMPSGHSENVSRALKGKNTWSKGRKLTLEHRRNISLGGKGRVFSPEHRARLSAARRRRTVNVDSV